MKPRLDQFVAFALVMLFGGIVYAQRPGAGASGWLSSYREGKEQAKKTGKPMMLVFRCVP